MTYNLPIGWKPYRIGEPTATLIHELQGEIYPDWMHEPLETFQSLLRHKDPLVGSYAAFAPELSRTDTLVAWTILDTGGHDPRYGRDVVYLYDFAVVPAYRHHGVARKLWIETLRDCRWAGKPIEFHARSCSYRLLTDQRLLWEEGYRITTDIFHPRHYNLTYHAPNETPDEHAHFVRIDPVGRRHSP